MSLKISFLETLRYLNKYNINNDQKLREDFFKSLMMCDENVPDYLSILSDAYHEGFSKQYEGNIAINYILSNIFGNEITNQLTDEVIEDKGYGLFISRKDAAHAVTYIGSIKGMKKLIEIEPNHFDFFKERLLMGLITRYCNDTIRNGIVSDRLNELIGIYAEHVRNLEISKDIPVIVDKKFIDELKELSYIKSEGCSRTVHSLINRVLPIQRENYFYEENGYNELYSEKNKKR